MVTVVPVEGVLPAGVRVQAARYADGLVVVVVDRAAPAASQEEEERAVAAALAALGG